MQTLREDSVSKKNSEMVQNVQDGQSKEVEALKLKVQQLESQVESFEDTDAFNRNKVRDLEQQAEIETNNTRIVQEQYSVLKNMYDDLKKNYQILLANMDEHTSEDSESLSDKINEIKHKSSTEIKTAKQELNKQIAILSSENKEIKYNYDKLQQEHTTLISENQERMNILNDNLEKFELKSNNLEQEIKSLTTANLELKTQ
mmetsp:Transcript_62403/g.135235  ORF Transcript_62403/g.135235 Transcript_62403/m.135235 type:complete len:202 (+) Transcript_62403:1448-2053(+)